MICGFHLFKNTKAEIFVHKARRTKIIVAKMRKLKIPVCYMPFRNSKILCFFTNKFRF